MLSIPGDEFLHKLIFHVRSSFLGEKKMYFCNWHLPGIGKSPWQGTDTCFLHEELEESKAVDMRITKNSSCLVLFLPSRL